MRVHSCEVATKVSGTRVDVEPTHTAPWTVGQPGIGFVAGAVCRSRSARSGTSLVLLLAMPGACACPCFVGDCRWGCSQLFAQRATAAAATCMRGDGRAPSAPSSTAAAATRPQHHGMHATASMGSKACVHAPTCADATPALLGASSPACRPVCQRPAAGPGLRGVEVTM